MPNTQATHLNEQPGLTTQPPIVNYAHKNVEDIRPHNLLNYTHHFIRGFPNQLTQQSCPRDNYNLIIS